MVKAKIFTAKTFHKRFQPKVNQFIYNVYYLAIPLSKIDEIKYLPPLINFKAKDHGNRDGSNLKGWIDELLLKNKIDAGGEIVLVSLPVILGYVIWWLGLSRQKSVCHIQQQS